MKNKRNSKEAVRLKDDRKRCGIALGYVQMRAFEATNSYTSEEIKVSQFVNLTFVTTLLNAEHDCLMAEYL